MPSHDEVLATIREQITGERDAGQITDPAARAVATHEVVGGHLIRPLRATHVLGGGSV